MMSKPQPRASAYRWYMRKRSPAKSAASSPPVPGRISSIAGRASATSRGSSASCNAASAARSSRAQGLQFLLGQLAHVGIGEHGIGLRDAGPDPHVRLDLLDHRAQFRVFAGQGGDIAARRLRHLRLKKLEALANLFEPFGVDHGKVMIHSSVLVKREP